jgi:hypothetical protein
MADEATLRRISKRQDQILEIQWAPWPDPPPALMRIAGVSEWWQQMRLVRNRDIDTLNKLVVNLQIASSTP